MLSSIYLMLRQWLVGGLLPVLDPRVDYSPSLLVDGGLFALSSVLYADSWGRPRLMSDIDFREDDDQVCDQVPSWLVTSGGADHDLDLAATQVALVNHVSLGEDHHIFDIAGHPQWQALYYVPHQRIIARMATDIFAVEFLRQQGIPNLPRVVYFSQYGIVPGAMFGLDSPVMAVYVIREKRGIDYVPECHEGVPGMCFSVLDAVMNDSFRLSFEQKSEIARAIVEWVMLLRNEWILVGDFELLMAETKIWFGRELFPATIGHYVVPEAHRAATKWNHVMHKLIATVAFILHGNIRGDGSFDARFALETVDDNRFVRSAFFVDSVSSTSYSAAVIDPDGPEIHFRFRSLFEITRNDAELAKVNVDSVGCSFAQYYEYLKGFLFSSEEYQAGSIMSVRDFVLAMHDGGFCV